MKHTFATTTLAASLFLAACSGDGNGSSSSGGSSTGSSGTSGTGGSSGTSGSSTTTSSGSSTQKYSCSINGTCYKCPSSDAMKDCVSNCTTTDKSYCE